MGKCVVLACCAIVACTITAGPAFSIADRRFDVAAFTCPGTTDHHFCQSQFNELNWVSANGHFLAMGSDAHKTEINNAGNFQAVYYDDLNTNWQGVTGTQRANEIHAWAVARFPTGVPQWIVLNEISAGTWPNTPAYRVWVKDVVKQLKNGYNHQTILCAPFATVGGCDLDWEAVSTYAYIGIECYLPGMIINNNGNSVAWCQAQYQASKTSYTNHRVPASKCFLVEDFAQTVSGTNWGRAGCSHAGWDNAINARSQAAHNVGFAGFVSYAWGWNHMLVSDADLIHFETTYRQWPLP